MFFTPVGLKKLFTKHAQKLNLSSEQDIDEVITSSRYGIAGYLDDLARSMGIGKAVEDGSLSTDAHGDVGIEFVTNILQGDSGLQTIKKFLNEIGRYGYVNSSSGLHVHVGAPDFKEATKSAKRVTLAMIHYGSVEEVFDKLVADNRKKNNSRWAQGMNIEKILKNYEKILAKEKHGYGLVDSPAEMLSQYDRYFKLNVMSLPKHGTLEFRQMEGSLNYQTVSNWISICTSFVDMVINTEHKFDKMFEEIKKVVVDDPEDNKINGLLLDKAEIYQFLERYLPSGILNSFTGNRTAWYFNEIRDLEETTFIAEYESIVSLSEEEFTTMYQRFHNKEKRDIINAAKKFYDEAFEIKGVIDVRMSWTVNNKMYRPIFSIVFSVAEYYHSYSATSYGRQHPLLKSRIKAIADKHLSQVTKNSTGMPRGIPTAPVASIQKRKQRQTA